MTFEMKDVAVLAGVGVTLLLGLWNLFENRSAGGRTRYLQTVTTQRVEWIEQVRQDLASFISLASSMRLDRKLRVVSTEEQRLELKRLKHVILLRLNPNGTIDQEIEAALHEAYRLAYSVDQREHSMDIALSDLTAKSQSLLKAEWERVKNEAVRGNK